jgi:hypothetical protein
MPWPLLGTHDYERVANREAVRLYDRNGAALGVVADAKRLGEGLAERAVSAGKYLSMRIGWRLPACQVTADLQPGCFIADVSGLAYTILSLDPPGTYLAVWRCTCIALMVLADQITWHLPARVGDSYGSPTINQSATIPAQPAAIHGYGQEEVLFQAVVSGFRKLFKVWTLQEIPTQLGTIGVDQNGVVYTLSAVQNQRRLDELPSANLVIEP